MNIMISRLDESAINNHTGRSCHYGGLLVQTDSCAYLIEEGNTGIGEDPVLVSIGRRVGYQLHVYGCKSMCWTAQSMAEVYGRIFPSLDEQANNRVSKYQ